MEDFHAAGGMATLLRELKPLLHLDALTVTGRTLGEEIDAAGARLCAERGAPAQPTRSTRRAASPCCAATWRRAAPSSSRARPTPRLMEHEGRAVVFENAADMAQRIDDPDLDVTADDILVLKHIGPKGAAMPEAGYLPIPKKLARAGVKDIVRISDGRMSGTAFGTIVLHVTPEAAVGGPLAWVQNGDRIRLSVARREITLCVSDEELARRATAAPVTTPSAQRGYRKLFLQTVTQADQGADFDFLMPPANGVRLPRS